MHRVIRNTYQQVSEFDRGKIVTIESVDYRSVIPTRLTCLMTPLPCKYGTNGLLSAILNGMQDLNALQ